MAAEEESYTKSAAERRLAMIKSQLIAQTQEDSVIGRQLKSAKRKDLAAQIQPLVAQVQLKSVTGGGMGGPRSVWNRALTGMGRKRVQGSGAGKASAVGVRQPYMAARGNVIGGKESGTVGVSRIYTGRTTILDKGAQWTTEGYLDNAAQPREQAKQMIEKDRRGNTGWVYDRVMGKSGKRVWEGKKMIFDPAGGVPTAAPPEEDQKTKGARILAERFKKRSQEQIRPLGSVPPTIGR